MKLMEKLLHMVSRDFQTVTFQILHRVILKSGFVQGIAMFRAMVYDVIKEEVLHSGLNTFHTSFISFNCHGHLP